MARKTFLLSFILFCSSLLSGQAVDYAVRSINFKVPLTAVNISPDGTWILVGSEKGALWILERVSWEEHLSLPEAAPGAIYDIEMSPKMDVIFLAAGNRIMLYDTTGIHITNWPHHNNTMWCMDISNDGRFIVSTEVNKTFQLINVYEGTIESSMRAHEDITLAVAFSPEGKQIASGSSDRRVLLWDVESKEVTGELLGHSDNIYDVKFSPDGKLVAACSKDGTIRVWTVADKKLKHLLKGHQDMVFEIEFSPDGKYMVSASADQAIKLWDMGSGELLYAYLDNLGSISDVEFLPDGKSFLSTGTDGLLKEWELHPEIFVLKYFEDEYRKELADNPVFEPRMKGEKKADYDLRMEQAAREKEKIIARYYESYLERYQE